MASMVKTVGRRMSRPANRMSSLVAKFANFDNQKKLDQISSVDKGVQILLSLKYQELARMGAPLPSFADVEFRSFSQNGEDGILLYIFSLIGTTNRRVVEMCVEAGIECNAANLIINHGWKGLLFDGDETRINFGRDFYARHPDTWSKPPQLASAWITRENANDLIASHGFLGEIDLFSLDMDGIDYWVLESLSCVQPRVVVLEFSSEWGPDASVTVPYDPQFRRSMDHPQYASASLTAYTKLMKRKGYRLVGVQRLGFNAFFVRDDLGHGVLPERTPRECYQPLDWTEAMMRNVSGHPWMEV